MDPKVCVGVEVVVARSHLIRAEELGHLAPARAAGQAGGVRRVGAQRGPGGVLDRRHGSGQRSGLGRLGRDDADGLSSRLVGLQAQSRRSASERTG